MRYQFDAIAGRYSFAWRKDRKDGDALEFKLRFDAQHIADLCPFVEKLRFDHSSRLARARGAPCPGPVVPGGSELDVETARHPAGQPTCSARDPPPTDGTDRRRVDGTLAERVEWGRDFYVRPREEMDESMGMGGGHPPMGGGGGAGHWGLMRSLRRDDSVKYQPLPRGTFKRVFQFARPYRRLLVTFFFLIVVDSVLAVANPLFYRAIIDDGILKKHLHVVVILAAVIAGLALLSVVNGVVERAVSARIGEGLIFDMRSKVFSHVNRMPIAFFTRTQTGALVSRLNNDVLGAQQAFTD